MTNEKRTKREVCYRIWQFCTEDYKSTEAYLAKMAEQGWELDGMWHRLPVARFRRIEAGRKDYCADFFLSMDVGEIQDYIDFCEGAGWRFLCRKNRVLYFDATETAAVPIQTNEEVEFENGVGKFHKEQLRGWAVSIGLVLLAGILIGLADPFSVMESYLMTTLAAAMVLYLAVGGYCMGSYSWRLLKDRHKIARGEAFPVLSVRQAQRRWKRITGGLALTLLCPMLGIFLEMVCNGEYQLAPFGGVVVGLLLGASIRAVIQWGEYDSKEQSAERNARLKKGVSPGSAVWTALGGIILLAVILVGIYSGEPRIHLKSSFFYVAADRGSMEQFGGDVWRERECYVGRSRWAADLQYDRLIREMERDMPGWTRLNQADGRFSFDRGSVSPKGDSVCLQKGNVVLRVWVMDGGLQGVRAAAAQEEIQRTLEELQRLE